MRKYAVLLKLRLMCWLGIDNNTKNIIDVYEELDQLRKIIKERTEYHVDVHQHAGANSQVVLIGSYHKRDFIKCYPIPDQDFDWLANHLRDLNKYARLDKIDAHPEISACIKRYL